MTGLLLYSTNVFLKHVIQRKYRNDVHYVWCSEIFDAKTAPAYSLEALLPASSNPADIYRQLSRDVQSRDGHSAKIQEQKASFKALAIQWYDTGEIAAEARDEIIFLADKSSFEYWRPLLYIIPRTNVNDRLLTVPPERRAGIGSEYIITDLSRTEFDIVEF